MKVNENFITRPTILVTIAIVLLVAACTSVKSDKNCSQFRSGDFVIKIKGKQGMHTFFIFRKDSIQIEVNPLTNDTARLSVRWIDDCSYEIRMLETTEHLPDSIDQIRKKMIIKTEIVSSTKDYYLFRTEVDNPHIILSDTAWVKK